MGLFTSNKPEAKQYHVAGRQLKCHHCENNSFHLRRSVLSQPPATLSDWAHRNLDCYECSECGFIHAFSVKENGKKEF